MIDLLLRFPDRETAIVAGQQLGVTSPADDGDGFATIEASHSLAVCVLGEHYVPTGNTLTDESGEQYPEMTGDGDWWVMVRSLDDIPVPDVLAPYVVTPDPLDETIPNRRWADG